MITFYFQHVKLIKLYSNNNNPLTSFLVSDYVGQAALAASSI